jgi:hypothetical protein
MLQYRQDKRTTREPLSYESRLWRGSKEETIHHSLVRTWGAPNPSMGQCSEAQVIDIGLYDISDREICVISGSVFRINDMVFGVGYP